VLWEAHKRELTGDYLKNSIRKGVATSDLDERLRLGSILRTRFKLVVALASSGQLRKSTKLTLEALDVRPYRGDAARSLL
jgi:hypothetical protein